ncbi:tetratricopeptide repeat protein [Oligoflexus tunisiensis]|uniref:tetratricopeptide repeat protein n=1 Tax=Oligoflexus tunisiensis TaxID=708132 RepID=UPI000A851AF8|nr:tetratricopeptide repeat protein [Oligoflexus tunisiensis]
MTLFTHKFQMIPVLLCMSLGSSFAPLQAQGPAQEKPQAPIFSNLGTWQHPISTSSKEAQKFFNQALILAFGFNHAEAERSFLAAAFYDPNCAICYWGAAWVLGPNINAGMDDEVVPRAYSHVQEAKKRLTHASPKEKAYIQAISERYVAQPVKDRAPLDRAFTEAMKKVVQQFPSDPDAATIYAESIMDQHPWDFWDRSGQPRPWTPELLSVLEGVIKAHPDHPGAHHFYIHAVEASKTPEMGLKSADRLGGLVPGAGHLVHMPAHIYIRTGRYQDAVVANEKAALADQGYITQCQEQGIYPLAYKPHNYHFLWAAATLSGQSKKAFQAAEHLDHHTDKDLMKTPGLETLQHYAYTPLYAMVRFGKWDEILKAPEPAKELIYPRGVWHYARTIAFARKKNFAQAQKELDQTRAIAQNPALENISIWNINSTKGLMKVAQHVAAGELALEQGQLQKAIMELDAAVKAEDELRYDEPATWHHPVRQILGHAYLQAGRFDQSVKTYQEDLELYPENGWSLYGLAQALEKQGKSKEAANVREQFKRAWAMADVELRASRF